MGESGRVQRAAAVRRGPAAGDLGRCGGGDGLVLDSVKRAEDGHGIVLRLYEAHGGRGTASVRLVRPVAAASRATLLEEPEEALEVHGGAVVVPFRPWEIVTVRVTG